MLKALLELKQIIRRMKKLYKLLEKRYFFIIAFIFFNAMKSMGQNVVPLGNGKVLNYLYYSVPTTPSYSQSNSNSHSVDGYYNRNGTYVESHRQTNSNNTQKDNYNSKGNYNPYNGKSGTRKSAH